MNIATRILGASLIAVLAGCTSVPQQIAREAEAHYAGLENNCLLVAARAYKNLRDQGIESTVITSHVRDNLYHACVSIDGKTCI